MKTVRGVIFMLLMLSSDFVVACAWWPFHVKTAAESEPCTSSLFLTFKKIEN